MQVDYRSCSWTWLIIVFLHVGIIMSQWNSWHLYSNFIHVLAYCQKPLLRFHADNKWIWLENIHKTKQNFDQPSTFLLYNFSQLCVLVCVLSFSRNNYRMICKNKIVYFICHSVMETLVSQHLWGIQYRNTYCFTFSKTYVYLISVMYWVEKIH